MISAKPTHQGTPRWWIVATDLDSRDAQGSPETSRCCVKTFKPIVKYSDANTFSCFCLKLIGESAADFIFVNDVVFEMDVMFGVGNGAEPSRIIFLGILKKSNRVAFNEGRPCCTRECLPRKGTGRGARREFLGGEKFCGWALCLGNRHFKVIGSL